MNAQEVTTAFQKAIGNKTQSGAHYSLDDLKSDTDKIVAWLKGTAKINIEISYDADDGGDYVQLSDNDGMFAELRRKPNGSHSVIKYLNYKDPDPDHAITEEHDLNANDGHELAKAIYAQIPEKHQQKLRALTL